ncbi:MAG: hypothetical protein P0S95_05745 [Rhabdochlamydiaceae bacterium]|nr:hypothetical protein [Candidatus Amphrikana amoebophyrae]
MFTHPIPDVFKTYQIALHAAATTCGVLPVAEDYFSPDSAKNKFNSGDRLQYLAQMHMAVLVFGKFPLFQPNSIINQCCNIVIGISIGISLTHLFISKVFKLKSFIQDDPQMENFIKNVLVLAPIAYGCKLITSIKA